MIISQESYIQDSGGLIEEATQESSNENIEGLFEEVDLFSTALIQGGCSGGFTSL